MEPVLLSLAFLALRIGLGVELVVHGWPKIKKPGGMAGWLEPMGFKPGVFWSWLVALNEFLGGLALIMGLLTRFAALFATLQFLLISFYLKPVKMKVPFKYPDGKAGWELDWVILFIALALLLTGSGAFGLDRLLNLPF
jgi:putative oxidoreductase